MSSVLYNLSDFLDKAFGKLYFSRVKGKQQLKYHFLLALVILGLNVFGKYVYSGREGLLEDLTYPDNLYFLSLYSSFFLIYGINYLWTCPLSLSKRKIVSFLGLVILQLFLFAGIRYLLEEVLLFELTGSHNYYGKSRRFVYYIFDNTYYSIQAILYSTSMFLFFEYVKNKERVHELQLEQKKAEMSFLKAQLEPHFLFNTLNTFYTELILVQPKTAKDIHRLSELLRYVTYEAKQDFMPLSKELKFIEDYLYFYRKRFEDRLFVNYSLNGKVGEQSIPSLVLIHFVENIFKHGKVNDHQHPATISISITEKELSLSTSNFCTMAEKYSEHGIGQQNITRRLEAIFKTEYTLNYIKNEHFFKASLKFPLSNISA